VSAFNTVSDNLCCPICGEVVPFEVQFKYGDTWQHAYRVGDRIRWGGNDYGTPSVGRVEVAGIGCRCPRCMADDLPFVIDVNDGVITRCTPAPR
jgi:hypothetical protein